MLKRPSSRRNSATEPISINLVPMLDTLVTLIAFLLFTTSFLSIVAIESPFPVAATHDLEERIKEKPLQLTLSMRPGEVELWSPFERIRPVLLPNVEPNKPDLRGVHEALIEVKRQFPREDKIVIVPHAGATYDVLVSVMDSVRAIEKTDPPVFVRNAETDADESLTKLFPEVIFGNLLGDG